MIDVLIWLKQMYPYLAGVLLVVAVMCTVNLIIYIETARIKTVNGMILRILATSLTWAFGIHFLLVVIGSSII